MRTNLALFIQESKYDRFKNNYDDLYELFSRKQLPSKRLGFVWPEACADIVLISSLINKDCVGVGAIMLDDESAVWPTTSRSKHDNSSNQDRFLPNFKHFTKVCNLESNCALTMFCVVFRSRPGLALRSSLTNLK
jgi:hypothetical protein